MIDLSTALSCIETMKRDRIYRGQKVGWLRQGLNGMVTSYSDGEVVLYKEELSPSDAELQMGEFRGMEQRPTGSVTVERPFTPEQISEQRERGSLISTVCTVIGVPQKYVEEVRV